MQGGVQLRRPVRVHLIETLRDDALMLSIQELRERRGVQPAARNLEAAGSRLRLQVKVVGQRDRSLHTLSITRVIPDPWAQMAIRAAEQHGHGSVNRLAACGRSGSKAKSGDSHRFSHRMTSVESMYLLARSGGC